MKSDCVLRGCLGVLLVSVCCGSVSLAQAGHAAVIDGTFRVELNGPVSSIAVQSDGKFLIGGSFTEVNGSPHSYLARLNRDGTIDESFAADDRPVQPVHRVLAVRSGIYVGAGDGIRRFNCDGTLAWHYPLAVTTFAVDSRDRVVFGGRFVRVENQYHRNIGRLHPDGTLDPTFVASIGCCAEDRVEEIIAVGDDVLVGGQFSTVNETHAAANLARLAGDGSFDPGYSAGAESGVLSLAAAPDGKVFVATQRGLARLQADGSDDPSFPFVSSGPGLDDRFVTVAVQPDGKPLVGGIFTVEGETRYVARFGTDGAPDASLGVQPNGFVRAIVSTANGSILLGGSFTEVNGIPATGLVRVLPDTPVLMTSRTPEGDIVLSWMAGHANFILESSDLGAANWAPVPTAPAVADGMNFVTSSAAGAGRLYRLALQP